MTNATRRSVVSGAGALALASLARSARSAQGARPNILWLVSEDNNPFIGAYGEPLTHTPTLDALARRGIRYDRAYSNAPVCAPSRFAILTGVYPEAAGPAHHMRARAKVAGLLQTYPELMRQAGYYCTNSSKTDYNCDIDPAAIWDATGAKAHWRGRSAGQPFMAVFNHETTHESRIFAAVSGRVKPEQVRVPGYLPDTPDIRRDIASYRNLMEVMDGQIAARLAELEADGLSDDTIVFYYSDNGGVLPRSKRYCYEEGLRCGLIVSLPERFAHLAPKAAGGVEERPVSFIDLAPTVLALGGVAAPAQMQGRAFLGPKASPQTYAFGMRNRMDERYDMIRTVSDGRFRYIRNYMPNRPLGQHVGFEWLAKGYQDWERRYRAGELTVDQARFFGPKAFEELYDLEADPDQLRNLAAAPDQCGRLRRLSAALDRHMLAINDNGFIPEGAAPEGYLQSRAQGPHPLKELMVLAAAAGRQDVRNLPLFQGKLTDSNALVRFWAAQGLLMLGGAASPAQEDLRRAMAGDTSPYVRVVAAEALAGLGQAPSAVEALAGLTSGAQAPPVQLMALNALTFVGDEAKAALPVIEQAALSKDQYVRSAGRYLAAVLRGEYRPDYRVFETAVAGLG